MSRQYAEMYYRQDEKRWVIVQPESVGILMVDTTDYMLALNEASLNGWELAVRTDNKFIMYRELPENAYSETFITMLSKDFKEMEKKLDDVIRAYEIAKDSIRERDIVIKSLMMEGRDSISVTGEFEEVIRKSDLESYSLTYHTKEMGNKLKLNVWIEEHDEEDIDE
jgi:hypothetical protein